MPGSKPPKPLPHKEYRARFDELVAEKRKMFQVQGTIRDKLTEMFEGDRGTNMVDTKELAALRAELMKIQDERREQRDELSQKQSDLRSLRINRDNLKNRLDCLKGYVNPFNSLEEVDEVIDHVTAGASALRNEKMIMKCLADLDAVRSLFAKIHPMTERLEVLEDQHAVMEGEVNDIMSKIKSITDKHNAQYEELNSKRSAATPAKDPKFEEKVTQLKSELSTVNQQIAAKNEEVDRLRDEQSKKLAAWKEWKAY